LVVIPAGTFMMGSPANEPGSSDIEDPQHRVTVQHFAAGKFDVTRGQWAEFVSATKRETPAGCSYSGFPKEKENTASWRNLGFAQDDNHPVVCVIWEDAQDYVHWLSQRTGRKYRLLTEAEWEYAARAGTTTAYPWGSTASHEYANYGPDKGHGHGLATGRDRWVYTSPVGSFPPNPFGLYDMNGNVLQWVQDCLAASYAGVPSDGSAYETDGELKLSGDFAELSGGRSCWYRILRGGDWGDPPEEIRSALRNFGPTEQAPEKIKKLFGYPRSAGVGFRVARTLD
jgi:formylglycine-generating enzyme required for sulfatase activity